MATSKKPTTSGGLVTVKMALAMTEDEIAQFGIFAHRRLGEELEDMGYAPWITEKGKTAFLMAKQPKRAELLCSQLRAYLQYGPRVPLAQKNSKTTGIPESQRIKDLEMRLEEAERRYKEELVKELRTADSLRAQIEEIEKRHKEEQLLELLQAQTTIQSLRGQNEELKCRIVVLETTYKELEAEYKEMEGWNTNHLNEIESLEEQLEDRKEVIQKLAALL